MIFVLTLNSQLLNTKTLLLRFAQNRFEDVKVQIEKDLHVNPHTGKKRELGKSDFAGAGAIFIQEKSKYDYLANLPETEDINEAVNNAMRLIENDYTDLAGTLPKRFKTM